MGNLYVVATPIGNLEDITIRAIKILLEVPVIACEDTRHTGILIKVLFERYSGLFGDSKLKKDKKYISVRDWNEAGQIEKILFELNQSDVALVSDAGTPLLADPGYKLVSIIRAANFQVIPIPGVSALTTAVSGAGLPSNKIVFWGFFNKKYTLDTEGTNVFYESPHRIYETVKYIQEKYSGGRIILALEMTKIHENFLEVTAENRENLKELRGEVTMLVSLKV